MRCLTLTECTMYTTNRNPDTFNNVLTFLEDIETRQLI